MEINLDPTNSVIKRFLCVLFIRSVFHGSVLHGFFCVSLLVLMFVMLLFFFTQGMIWLLTESKQKIFCMHL